MIKRSVKIVQGVLKCRSLDRQAVAITGVKSPQRVGRVQRLEQFELAPGRWLTGPGDKFCVQHLTFAQLLCRVHAWLSEHVAQTRQAAFERGHRQFKKEVGVALAGAGVDLAAVALHVGHQVVGGGVALGAEEQQVFKKMRQPWPGGWHVVAACVNP